MRVLRVYHAGRDAAHRERERALVRAGADVTLVVPREWPGADALGAEPFEVVEVDVRRPGDVNQHRLRAPAALADLVAQLRPDIVDLHEEPFSAVVHQLLRVLPDTQTVAGYTAQNLDKRFPPPFAQWERRALARLDGLYPCTRQAASVAVGKGFRGPVRVLPLGVDPIGVLGASGPPGDDVRLLVVGRLVPEKGIVDAVEVLAALRRHGPATLKIVGTGPEGATALARAVTLGVRDAVGIHGWTDSPGLAEHYRAAQVLLVPSRSTRTWVEQFGRTVIEAQSGGAAVVGYASGSLPEVVGDAGLLVPEGDVARLAAAVRSLVEDPARWARLRDAGLAVAQASTWDVVAAAQLELYDDALTAGTGVRRIRPDRARARAAYGSPAQVPGSARPFALPVLREDREISRRLERVIDRFHGDPPVPERRLRVVHLDHTAKLSGAEIALERLVSAQPSVDSHVILAEDGPLRARLETAGATVEVLPLSGRARTVTRSEAAGAGGAAVAVHTAAHVLRLARRLRQLRPDVVHTNSLKAGYYGTAAARLAGVPVVWHVRDRIADDYLPGRAVRLTRRLLRTLPDLVLANSRTTAATTGVRARVIGDPYRPTQAPTLRQGDASYVVGVVGRLSEWKGQHVVLRAVAEIPEVTLRVVGLAMFREDAYAASLRVLAEELGIADRVTWVGFSDDVEAELAQIDVLVHSSVLPEPFGQVVVEGLAAGRAVVATDAGGPAEIITDGADGLLTRPGDVDDLVRALRTLSDPLLRARLGVAGRRRAEDFAPDRIGPAMDLVWRDAVAGSRRRR